MILINCAEAAFLQVLTRSGIMVEELFKRRAGALRLFILKY
jgi:hypothetical protein